MKNVFIITCFLIFLSIISHAIKSLPMKCFSSSASCTRSKSLLKVLDGISTETMICKPQETITPPTTTHLESNNSKQICINVNTTRLGFLLAGCRLGQTCFPYLSDMIWKLNVRHTFIFMIGIDAINVESPLNLGASLDKRIYFFIYLDVSAFEFFDNKGERVQTCSEFERLGNRM